MVINSRLRRWLLLSAALVVVLAFASIFVTLPLRDSDKADAARELVAWIVEGRDVPGFGEAYPDAQWMPKRKRFFVICDFIPPEVSLSDDQRVQRITAQKYDEVFERHRFDDTDYMVIELKSESPGELVLEFSNAFGGLAGHGYRFEFRRKLWGLRANGKFLRVS
jgi:hypothetical protein